VERQTVSRSAEHRDDVEQLRRREQVTGLCGATVAPNVLLLTARGTPAMRSK